MAPEEFKRKLTAILSADVQGYSRLMGDDEQATVKTITAYRKVMTELIQEHDGRVVDAKGDNVLAEFPSVVDAIKCSVEIQRELKVRNADLPEHRRMEFRIGINLGDVIEKEDTIYGDGVNIAARIESLAEAGGICITGKVHEEVEDKLGLQYEYLGKQEVKNIKKPVSVYKVLPFPGAANHRRSEFPSVTPTSAEDMTFPLPDKPSIAVLPFTNTSADPKQDYFSDGFTEQIITSLSMIPRLFVIDRNSTFTYKGKPVKVQQVAEELGVRYVLEGGVQRAGDKVRITVQLIDALSGRHFWANRYDRDMKDIFELQDEVTLKIISALGVELTRGDSARFAEKRTNNVEAYIKYMQGLEYYYRSNEIANLKARKLFEEAIALDPDYPEAYARLGWTQIMDVMLGSSKSPRKSFEKAAELAQKSIELDESVPSSNGLLAQIYGTQRQYEKAIAQGERAVALAPSIGYPYYYLGLALLWGDRKEEAIQSLEKAIRLDPKGPGWYYHILGLTYSLLGRYEEAIAHLKKSIGRDPDFRWGYISLTATYTLAGRLEEGRAAATEVLRIDPKFSLQQFEKAMPWKNRADLKRWCEALRKAGLK